MRRRGWISWGSVVGASLAACVADAPGGPGSDGGAVDGAVDGFAGDSSADAAAGDAGRDGAAQDAQPDTNGWTPSSLTNVVVWLDGTRGLPAAGMQVQQWDDQSGKNHHAVQRSPGSRPVTLSPEAGVNGQVVVRFGGGTNLGIADHADFQWATGDFLVAEVIRHTTATNFAALFDKQSGGALNTGPALWANFPGGGTVGQIAAQLDTSTQAVGASGGYNNGAPHMVVMQRTGATLTLRVDKSTVDTNPDAGIDVSATGTKITLGANGVTTQSLDGEIAEVIAVKGPVTVGDELLLEAYFSRKYGL